MPQIAVWLDVTRHGLRHGRAGVVRDVDESELDHHGHGADCGHDPQKYDHLDGAPQTRPRLREHQVADGDVALDGEGGDREDGRVRRRLRGHRPQHAERLAEYPGVGRPEGVRLLRQAEQQHEQVGDGQVEQVVVGDRLHVLGASDDEARAHVADDARHEDHAVDDRHRDHLVERLASRPQ